MKILSSDQIRAADSYTIEHEPILPFDLMERASGVFSAWFANKFRRFNTVSIFVGVGNNGGDGLAIARMLDQKGFKVEVYIIRYSTKSTPEFQENEIRLMDIADVEIYEVNSLSDLKLKPVYEVIIDAIWGTGINRPLEGLGKEVISFLNGQRAIKVSVDIPSGMAADFKIDSTVFEADHTLTFELPKLSFFFSSNYNYVGDWECRTIGLAKDFIDKQETNLHYFEHSDASNIIKPRLKFSHKGSNGHSLIVAGSYGKIGAGILAAMACLHSGSGLVTIHLPHAGVNPVHAAFPEAMLSIDQHEFHVTHVPDESHYDAIGIGPGLDKHPETQKAVYDLLINSERPLVIDADALNILAENQDWLEHIPRNSILTPHPKEFMRLFGDTADEYDRLKLQMELAQKLEIFIILKGAHTAIACPDGSCWFNSSGNPALATAGSGDVLTGIITGLLAQGYNSTESALLGVYIHGRAADLYIEEKNTDRMIATQIIEFINQAFSNIGTI